MKRVGLALLLVALASCRATDPQYRAGLYTPTGSNKANLVVEIADPADLVHGKSSAGGYTPEAVIAVNRLRVHGVLALPDSYFAKVDVSGNGNANSGAVAAPAGSQ
jgi:hypothetical protein